VLHATADLINDRVSQPDGADVSYHYGDMAKRATRALAQPWRASATVPSRLPSPGTGRRASHAPRPCTVGHHIQQPTHLQIHQAGVVLGLCQADGLEEARLIET
jgi:hypothetical protein